MSEENLPESVQPYETQEYASYEQPRKVRYSYFYPVLIFAIGFLLWNSYQLYVGINQWRALEQQQVNLKPTLTAAITAHNQFKLLLNDLAKTSVSNANAAQILKEAGLRYNPSGDSSTNAAAGVPLPPADSK